jgi:HK97 family phage portal protein
MMGYLKDRFKGEVRNLTVSESSFLSLLLPDISSKEKEITYYKCLKILSETIGKLPVWLYEKGEKGGKRKIENNLVYLLTVQPNEYQTAAIFWANVEYNRNHKGNCYVYVKRDAKGDVRAFRILPDNDVTVYVDDKGLLGSSYRVWYQYRPQKSEPVLLRSDDVLHFKNWHSSGGLGIVGVPAIDMIGSYIERNLNNNEFLKKLSESGMVGDNIVIKYTGKLDPKAERELIKQMESFNAESTGKYLPIPIGMDVENLSSKLTDSQFLELNKYNSTQIAGVFGLSPQQINDFENGNFANSGVQEQLWYKGSLLFVLTVYEQELTSKLLSEKDKYDGVRFKFDVRILLRGDFKERIETYSKAVNNMILTPNEVREEEDKEWKEGGDELIGNGNYMPAKMAGQQWSKEGDSE